MFKIGDFSKFSRVSVKALRYYDEIGLLKPVRVDELSGYRYYSAGQLTLLNRIVGLKNLGLSLNEISRMLADNLPAEKMIELLRIKHQETLERLSEEESRLPPIAIYHDCEYREKDVDVEVVVPIAGTLPPDEKVKMQPIPEVEQMACLVYKGPYENFNQAYKALMTWVETNGYQIIGPNREIYLKGPGMSGKDNPAEYITEIQVPVKKA